MKLLKGLGLFFFLFILFTSSVRADFYAFDLGRNNVIEPQIIERPQEFQYIYGLISRGEDVVDYYAFTLTQFTPQMQIQLLTPDTEAGRVFAPSLIFVDPQQKQMVGAIPFGFPPTLGGRVHAWAKDTKKVTDQTMFENFQEGILIKRDLPAGRYILAVFDPASKGGNYVLRVGAKEANETILDKFKGVFTLLRIKFKLY